jgi:hypothetical protein
VTTTDVLTPRTLGAPVWRGERGRTEVWYSTFTDDTSGLGGWIHAETVAPTDGAAPYAHGWVALFPAHGPAVVERFGPGPVEPPGEDAWFRLGDVVIGPGFLRGTTATGAWDLTFADNGAPVFTFPRVVWERHLLPGAQIVPSPDARVRGQVSLCGVQDDVDGHGALARIFGHGSAERWGWLHAPLGDGAVLEIVTATARRPGLRLLPPLAMVQLRRPGLPDWPRNPALAAVRLRTELRPDGFTVRGKGLHLDVSIPVGSRVALRYVDPDGSTSTCTNSERASATIRFDDRTWHLDGTAHAEVGTRPADPTSD